MNTPLPATLDTLVQALSRLPQVAAIALGGSHAAGRNDAHSDFDIYVFTYDAVPLDIRRDLALRFDNDPEIGNSWWGDEDAWSDGMAQIDLMFWDASEFEAQLRRVIEHHQPSLGYSTSFWFTIHHAIALYDSDGWLAQVQELTSTPYPSALSDAIVQYNAPLMRDVRASYRHQIELAIRRNDAVSVNHRIAALLASVFDIVFALNHMLHPGEKRQMAWIASLGDCVPPSFEQHIRDLLTATGDVKHANVMNAINALCDDVETMIVDAGKSDP